MPNNRAHLTQGESQLSLDRVDVLHGATTPTTLTSATSDLSLAESDERRAHLLSLEAERRSVNMTTPDGQPPPRPPPPSKFSRSERASADQVSLTNGVISPAADSPSPLGDEEASVRPPETPEVYLNGAENLYDEAEGGEDDLAPLPIVLEYSDRTGIPPIPRRSPSTVLGPSPVPFGEREHVSDAGSPREMTDEAAGGTNEQTAAARDLQRHRHPSPPDGVGSVTLDKLASPPSESPTGIRESDAFPEPPSPADRTPVERETPARPASSSSQRSRFRTDVARGSGSSSGGSVPDSIRASTPWQRKHLFRICQNARPSTDRALQHVPPPVLDRLSIFLYRFLVRILREARSLSWRFGRCARHEIVASVALVAPRSLADACIAAGAKAKSHYSMPTACLRSSKCTRCGLVMPIGRLHQWLVQCEVAPVVSDDAAIYLAAAVEHFGEMIVQRALNPADCETSGAVTVELLDFGVSASADLWAVAHKHSSLVSIGVTSDGSPTATVNRSRDALGTPRPGFSAESAFASSSSIDSLAGHIRTQSRRNSSQSTTSTPLPSGASPIRGQMRRNLSSSSSLSGRVFSCDSPPSLNLAVVDSREQLERLITQGGTACIGPYY